MKAKRIISIILVIFISMFIISCNGDGQDASEDDGEDNSSQEILEGNLIARSMKALKLLKDKDMEEFVEYVHPDKGLRFSPYAYIDTEEDQTFTKEELLTLLEDTEEYEWGNYDGRGDPIKLTFEDYYDEFVYNEDFLNPNIIGNDISIGSGNTINNMDEAYPEAKFIEYHFQGFDPQYNGQDWQSLRLVFEELEDEWYLVGIVHSEWTI